MSHELTPNQPVQPHEPGGDSVLFPMTPEDRTQQIADARQEAAAAKVASLMEDPRIVTLIETGQLTTADELAKQRATGTTELPKVKYPKHKPVNRRGGRSVNEGSDSEHDPYWNAPAAELSPVEAASSKEQLKQLAEEMRLKNAAAAYRADIESGGVNYALARLRAHGFRPDPSTSGETVVRIK